MNDLSNDTNDLIEQVAKAIKKLDIDQKASELKDLKAKSADPNFWQNSETAQAVMQNISTLEKQVDTWQNLAKNLHDLKDMLALNDQTLEVDLTKQYVALQKTFEELQHDLAFNGPYDNHDIIMNIHAGAGGTDAQDWAQMLLRMYVRYCEKQGYKVKMIDESSGDEAGIKSASLEIKGDLLYGKLKGEAGVHRLVRLSPFNSDNLRQTSFAKVDILPKIDQPTDVPLDENDLKIDVFRAGGHGGQSVNTTDSAVRVTHVPTGITVSIQNERSQIQNKETALTILRSKLAALQLEQHKENIAEIKGPNQSAEWGNQIRSYVLHPYTMVKDLRTKYETSDAQGVLDGELEGFIEAYLKS